jgi:hypothetical protein
VIGLIGEGEGILASSLEAGEILGCRKRLPLERDRRPELYGMLLV